MESVAVDACWAPLRRTVCYLGVLLAVLAYRLNTPTAAERAVNDQKHSRERVHGGERERRNINCIRIQNEFEFDKQQAHTKKLSQQGPTTRSNCTYLSGRAREKKQRTEVTVINSSQGTQFRRERIICVLSAVSLSSTPLHPSCC